MVEALRLQPTHAALSLDISLGTQVTIGDDGILVRRFWRRRYIPIGLVVKVETDDPALGEWERGRRLCLHLATGEAETLWVTGGPPTRADYETDQRALERLGQIKRRIEDAMARATSRAAANAPPPLPARGGRSVAAWVRQLRHLPQDASYRQAAAPPPDVLWRMVEDPIMDAPARAAAAVALGPLLDRHGRKRLDALADATVAPLLRQALEAVACQDDRQLAKALDALAPEER